MNKAFWTVVVSAIVAVAAEAAVPAAAAAQCTWGCTCLGSACGCNRNGNGKRCDASGSGCVVESCEPLQTLFFAPDGSLARVAALDGARQAEDGEPPATLDRPRDLSGTARWEAAGEGRSVARHCSGVIVARYYAETEAAAIRDASRTLTL